MTTSFESDTIFNILRATVFSFSVVFWIFIDQCIHTHTNIVMLCGNWLRARSRRGINGKTTERSVGRRVSLCICLSAWFAAGINLHHFLSTLFLVASVHTGMRLCSNSEYSFVLILSHVS